MQSAILPKYPAVGLHTVVPQRPLEQHRAGCHTMWPEASRAGKSCQIQNLQKAKHQGGK